MISSKKIMTYYMLFLLFIFSGGFTIKLYGGEGCSEIEVLYGLSACEGFEKEMRDKFTVKYQEGLYFFGIYEDKTTGTANYAKDNLHRNFFKARVKEIGGKLEKACLKTNESFRKNTQPENDLPGITGVAAVVDTKANTLFITNASSSLRGILINCDDELVSAGLRSNGINEKKFYRGNTLVLLSGISDSVKNELVAKFVHGKFREFVDKEILGGDRIKEEETEEIGNNPVVRRVARALRDMVYDTESENILRNKSLGNIMALVVKFGSLKVDEYNDDSEADDDSGDDEANEASEDDENKSEKSPTTLSRLISGITRPILVSGLGLVFIFCNCIYFRKKFKQIFSDLFFK